MADGSIGNAYVTVKPKVDNNFGKAIEEKGAPAGSGFGSKFSGAAQKALSAGAVALGNILANVVSTAANAIKDFVADSIQTGMSFEKSMSQVAATMGVSVGEIQDLSTYAKEMGATTAFSATQAAEALNYMALAGYNSEQAMTMLPNVLNLAAAGNGTGVLGDKAREGMLHRRGIAELGHVELALVGVADLLPVAFGHQVVSQYRGTRSIVGVGIDRHQVGAGDDALSVNR